MSIRDSTFASDKPKVKSCPHCGNRLAAKALVDSDDRLYGRWLHCACGFDTRYCLPEEVPE